MEELEDRAQGWETAVPRLSTTVATSSHNWLAALGPHKMAISTTSQNKGVRALGPSLYLFTVDYK